MLYQNVKPNVKNAQSLRATKHWREFNFLSRFSMEKSINIKVTLPKIVALIQHA